MAPIPDIKQKQHSTVRAKAPRSTAPQSQTHTTPPDRYTPQQQQGLDRATVSLRKLARESGYSSNQGGQIGPVYQDQASAKLPSDWRTWTGQSGVTGYSNGNLPESSFRVTPRKKSPKRTLNKQQKTTPKRAPKGFKPKSIPRFEVIPKTQNPPEQAKEPNPIGPHKQRSGKSQRTELSRKYNTVQEAKQAFRRQTESLLRPGGWNSQAIGITYADSPRWDLLDSKGIERPKNPRLEQNDILRIANVAGTDFYVQAENVNNQRDNVQFTLRPCKNPQSPNPGETTHFFTKEATRTFTLQREGNEVFFVTEGRNETLNIASESGPFVASNAVGGAAVMYGMGSLHWELFAHRLLNR